jgi:S1-C subfamily serine protease
MDEHVQDILKWVRNETNGEGDQAPCEVSAGEISDVELLDAYSRAVTAVVEAVGPAVVSISIGQESTVHRPEQIGAGSGVVIAPDGYILTNDHVVHNAKALNATFPDGTHLDTVLVGTDSATDLALVRANASSLPLPHSASRHRSAWASS